MGRRIFSVAVLGLLLGGLLAAPHPIPAGEHFLAIEVPTGMHADIKHRQKQIHTQLDTYLASIKDEHTKKAIDVRYHSPRNLHISLMRFGHIPPSKIHAYKQAIRHAATDHLHQFDMADKVHHATLHVKGDEHVAYLVYHVKPSKRLSSFMDAVTAELNKKHLHHRKSDTPDNLHISIARVKGISPDKLRQILEGHVSHLESGHFPVHALHLKVSHEPKKHLYYTDVGHSIHVPGAKK